MGRIEAQRGISVLPRQVVIERLQSVHLFSNLSVSDLDALAALVRTIEYTRGSIVYRQGEPGDRYFIVHRGLLRATRLDPEGRVTEVRRLGPGEGVGETSLLLGDVRDVTLEVLERSLLLYIERGAFEQFLKQHPRAERLLRMRSDVAERRRYPRFSWMEEDEIPIKVVHKHPVLLLLRLIVPGLLVVTAIGGGAWGLSQLGGQRALILVVSLVISLVGTVALAFAFARYIDWRNDVYVVTNRRVAHRERVGIMQEERLSIAPLHAIQDVYLSRVGMLSHIFDFGDLTIETAGGAGRVIFVGIPRPEEVQEAIFTQRTRALALARLEQREEIRRLMHRHLAGEPEQETEEAQAEGAKAKEEEERRQAWVRSCLLLPLSVLGYFVPRSWERRGETVTWRKHWFGLSKAVGLPFAAFVLALLALGAVLLYKREWLGPALIACSGVALITFPLFLWLFEDWRNDFYQVTSTRIVHVERKPLLISEERREASLEQITNVRTQQTFWGKLLRYGDVIIETAAPAGMFHFRMVSRPQDVQKEIFAHIAALRRRRQEQEAARRRAEMMDWFTTYEEIKRARPSSGEGGE